jgi:MoaA/NifB/PqqE/SkfB family radical SAM enzyme
MIVLDRTSERSFNNIPIIKDIFRGSDVVPILIQIFNKRAVFTRNLTLAKVVNCLSAAAYYLFGKWQPKFPPILKIETTILCQLRCPTCAHGYLEDGIWIFKKSDGEMSFGMFCRVIDQVRKTCIAASLYNLGEPMLNKNMPRMIRYAQANGINTYFTSNFSMPISNEHLTELVESGLTLIVVAMDGFSQETYSRTRINGNFTLVRDNLQRLCFLKRARGRKYPIIQVQSLIFEHNIHEKEKVTSFCREVGVDILHFGFGAVPITHPPHTVPSAKRIFPKCLWPFFNLVVRYNGDVNPCCIRKNDLHLIKAEETWVAGNVGEQSISDIFTGPQMSAIRSLSRDPTLTGPLSRTFAEYCLGCPILYV